MEPADSILMPLTDRQETVLRLVLGFLERASYPPTIGEIQEGCELCSPGSVSRALDGLIRKGYLTREKGRHRGLRPGPALEAWRRREAADGPEESGV